MEEEEEAEDNDGAVQLLEAVGDTKTDVVVFSSYTTIATTTLYIYIYLDIYDYAANVFEFTNYNYNEWKAKQNLYKNI